MASGKQTKTLLACGAALGVGAYLYWQNAFLRKTTYYVQNPKFRGALEGLRLVQLSDLNIPKHRVAPKRLLKQVVRAEPDLILVTGNILAAAGDFDAEMVHGLAEGLMEIAPVYAVYGSHELENPDASVMERLWTEAGVRFLHDEAAEWTYHGETISLLGLGEKVGQQFLKHEPLRAIERTGAPAGQVKFLLAHHPEAFLRYHDDLTLSPDLVFSGHAEGGGINIPGVGPLYSPSQGYQPAYTSGVYGLPGNPDKRLIISRGIGQPETGLRINNQAEIVLVICEGAKLSLAASEGTHD